MENPFKKRPRREGPEKSATPLAIKEAIAAYAEYVDGLIEKNNMPVAACGTTSICVEKNNSGVPVCAVGRTTFLVLAKDGVRGIATYFASQFIPTTDDGIANLLAQRGEGTSQDNILLLPHLEKPKAPYVESIFWISVDGSACHELRATPIHGEEQTVAISPVFYARENALGDPGLTRKFLGAVTIPS